jgi:alanine-synthesizing transaminase
MFSKRFNYNIEENKISKLLKQKKSAGIEVLDLTESNPTKVHLEYNELDILKSISHPDSMKYNPNPKGIQTAREAISNYYKEKNVKVNENDIFLTSGTSEAYSFVLKLLTDPYDEILIPRPGYPLFSFIAEMESVKIQYYDLNYSDDGFWKFDFDSLKSSLTKKSKAIICINPNNPTGNYIKKDELSELISICKEYNLALICDEVFMDYEIEVDKKNIFSFACNKDVLTFTLNGLSKICGLPQMKLSWIVVSGNRDKTEEAKSKLEIIADTYLSVGTPIQLALRSLFEGKELIQTKIRNRIIRNYNFLKEELLNRNNVELLNTEGGWYSVFRVKSDIDEESLTYSLLIEKNVYVHPGYFFDFKDEGYIVVSLLSPEEIFAEGMKRILVYLSI